jgi:hypothetical protein
MDIAQEAITVVILPSTRGKGEAKALWDDANSESPKL